MKTGRRAGRMLGELLGGWQRAFATAYPREAAVEAPAVCPDEKAPKGWTCSPPADHMIDTGNTYCVSYCVVGQALQLALLRIPVDGCGAYSRVSQTATIRARPGTQVHHCKRLGVIVTST